MRRYYGLDLLDVWRGELSARKVCALLNQLPRHARYIEAVAADDDAAEAAGAADGSTPARPQAPSLSEWPPEVEYLAMVVDRLGEVINAVIASGGGKPKKVRPLPRPVTAADRARQRRRSRSHDRVVARVAEARARAGITTNEGGDR